MSDLRRNPLYYLRSNKDLQDIPRRVAVYARVSTEHEAQLYALENQVDWYNEILERHSNWTLVEQYIDRGITGTSAKKRPSFMKMIDDAANEEFDIVVTREVSRFARNTVDTLQYTRELKRNGIEVYFVEDNIWTFDPDGELRLTIMATLAQDESRKTSLRAKAGQRTSMEKGVFFQNGSILGYDYNKYDRTLTINEEQAETVRMIFDLYNQGLGVRKIQWELEKAGRKTARGSDLWSASVISRVLKNKIYCGYLVWYKQFVPDFLEQKKINNHGEKEQFEVLGSHEPIVTLEEWQKANDRLNARKSTDGKQTAKRKPVDVWTKKLRCICGRGFNRRAWHKDAKNGKEYYGYTCYNVVKSGSAKTRANKGLPMEGVCTTPSVSRWKLEAMALYIFRTMSINKDHIIEVATRMIDSHIKDGESDIEKNKKTIKFLNLELEKLEKKIDNIIDMRTEGEISKEVFLSKKEQFEDRVKEIEAQLDELNTDEETQDYSKQIALWKDCLEQMLNYQDADKIPEYVIDAMVDYILVDGTTFKWKFRFMPEEYDLTVEGNRESNGVLIDNKSGEKVSSFAQCFTGSDKRRTKIDCIKVAEYLFTKDIAIKYMNKRPQDRIHKWYDILIEIYF